MNLLLDFRGMIISVNENITEHLEDGVKLWLSGTTYISDNNYSCVNVSDVPLDVTPNKYFYIDGEFILNPNWVNTPEEVRGLNKRIDEVLLNKAESELEIDERLTVLELGLI